MILSFAHNDYFASFLYLPLCSVALARSSRIMLNNSGVNKHLASHMLD